MGSYNEQALDEYQAVVDRQAARDDALEAIGELAVASMKVEFISALNGGDEKVSAPCFTVMNGRVQMLTETVANAVIDTLIDDADVRDALLLALRESECPFVAKFKMASAKQHALSHCDALVAFDAQGARS